MDPSFEYEPLPNSHRVIVPGAVQTGEADRRQNIEVMVRLRGKQPLPELSGGPAERMTREQLADAYGASREDMDTVIQTYSQLGLKSSFADGATRTVRFLGSVAEMEKAFHVQLFDYSHPDGDYRGYIGDIAVPKSLAGIVEGVFGLDNRRVAHRR